jgi:hypothetical protein
MLIKTSATFGCDEDGCPETITITDFENSTQLQAKLTEAGWEGEGYEHKCPAHRNGGSPART